MNPTQKTTNVEMFLNLLAGCNRKEKILNDICVACGEPAEYFEDELSKKEYQISGLCQECQNDFFG